MNRREFLGTSIAAGLAVNNGLSLLGQQTSPSSAGVSSTAPSWLTEGPIVFAGCWDDFPLYQRRLGGAPVWLDDLYRKQCSEETILNMKKAGVTLGIIHFFKGFGLEAEQEHIAQTRVLTKLMKKHGIRVGVYVGSTFGYETFLVEKPEAAEWLVPDYMGHPVYYGDQTFRRRVYMMHPGYREYIKKVLHLAIVDLGVDLIHFDNTSQRAQADVFQHPLAIEDFRKYLAKKYPPSEMKLRLGITDIRYVTAPRLEHDPKFLNDPLLQEWALFRNHQLVSYYKEMQAYVRSLNPAVAIDNNPSTGLGARNLMWSQGMDYAQLLGAVDAAWTEEGIDSGVNADGVLVSRIRTLKAATTLGKHIFCYTWGARGNWGFAENTGSRLQMAESMAYNKNCLGMVGNFNAIGDLEDEPLQYIRFFHEHFEFYRDATPRADVALLYSTPSMGFSGDRPASAFMLASQMLIQAQIPFEIIFDQHLSDLSRYRALFIADQECLSDQQVEAIRSFVIAGGSLIATGHTSLYNERRERRVDYALADCLGVKAPIWSGAGRPEIGEADQNVTGPTVSKKVGKGFAVYIPEIRLQKYNISENIRNQRVWKLAENNDVLRKSVESVLAARPSIQIPDPRAQFITIELREQRHKQRWVLHLLNYDFSRTSNISNLPVRFNIPEGMRVAEIMHYSPDTAESSTIKWHEDAGIECFIDLHVYSVLVVNFSRT